MATVEIPGSPVQYLTISLASNPQPQTLHVAQITNIIEGPGGKASIVTWGGAVLLTEHDYNPLIDKLTTAGLLLDLRN